MGAQSLCESRVVGRVPFGSMQSPESEWDRKSLLVA